MLAATAATWPVSAAQTTRVLSASLLTLALLSAQLLPPLPQYLGADTSMVWGTCLAASAIAFIRLLNDVVPRPELPPRVLDTDVAAILVIVLVVGTVLLHAIVADWFQSLANFARCWASLLPLVFLLAGGIVFGKALRGCTDRSVDFAVRVSFGVLSIAMMLQLIGLQPRPEKFSKSIFPFTETSHFALAFFPVLLYRCVRAGRRAQLWWLLGCLAVGLLLQSLSLLVGCLLAAVACRRFVPVTVLALLLLLVGLPLGLDYYRSRLDFSGSVVNLSNLVYVQGWEMVLESWTQTSGWGIGFQQLGFRQTQVAASELIRASFGEDYNVTDASFVFSKFVSEFGGLGLVVMFVYVVGAARCMRALRAGGESAAITLARCIVVAYSIDIFVRGTGYFTQSTLVFLAGVAALLSSDRRSMPTREEI